RGDLVTGVQTCALPISGEQRAEESIGAAIAEARRTGTVLFGDISNTLAPVARLVDTDSAAVVFHELIGFNADRAEKVVAEAMTKIGRASCRERADTSAR